MYSDSEILGFRHLRWVHRPHHWHHIAWSSSLTSDLHYIEQQLLSSASPSACIISSSVVGARVQKGAFWCFCSERIRFVVPMANPGHTPARKAKTITRAHVKRKRGTIMHPFLCLPLVSLLLTRLLGRPYCNTFRR